jgi:hypothetical protein
VRGRQGGPGFAHDRGASVREPGCARRADLPVRGPAFGWKAPSASGACRPRAKRARLQPA